MNHSTKFYLIAIGCLVGAYLQLGSDTPELVKPLFLVAIGYLCIGAALHEKA